MADQSTPNADSYQFSLNFESFHAQVYDRLTGRKTQLKWADVTMPDGTMKKEPYFESSVDETKKPLCADAGGDYVVGHLRYYMNKHFAMGNLKRDEVADICSSACKSTFGVLMMYPEDYGVVSNAKIAAEGCNVFDSLYGFMSSIKEGDMRKFGENILDIRWMIQPRQEAPAQKAGIFG